MNLCMDAPHGHGLRRATSGGKLASPDGELLASFVQQDRQHAQVGADWGGRHVRPKQQDQAGVLAAARGGSAALGGKPIIRGQRISVEMILKFLAAGWSVEQVLEEYPTISREDVQAVFALAYELVSEERYIIESKVA